MTYKVVLIPLAEDVVATLPRDGLMAYLGAHIAIAVDPRGGRPVGDDPDGPMRQRTFGEDSQGMVVYVVLDREEHALVVRVMWAG